MGDRILHLITSTDRRGAERFGVDLGDALAARGHETRVVALTRGPDSAGFPVEVLGRGRFSAAGWRRLRLRVRAADVVIGHGSDTLLAGALTQPASGARFVYGSIGDPMVWSSSRLRTLRVRAFLSRASAVVALWPAAAGTLVEHHRVPAGRVVVIPNGRSASQFPLVRPEDRAAARARLGVEGPVAAYLGALSPEKRVDVAIRAIRLGPGTLVVAGDGSLRRPLEQLAAEEAPGRVRFLGTVTDPALVLAAADVVVLTSATEGLPGALIEAGLSGLPAVATDVGGVSTVVVDGETGVLAEPGDVQSVARGLTRALAEGPSMGQKAYVHCLANFEMGPISAQWDDLLRRVLASH